MEGHTDAVLPVDFTSDARYGLSGSWDNTLKFWDLSTGNCVRTIDADDDIYSVSASKMFLDMTYPNGGEKFYEENDTSTILWDTFGAMDSVLLELTTDAGKNWSVISKCENNGTFKWTLPEVKSTECKIKISGYSNNIVVPIDESDDFFEMNTVGFKNRTSSSLLPYHSFSVSPNPFSGRLMISLPSSGAIYSLTGQLIMKLPKGKHSIDTSKWREGV
ncbi:MAG: hypothetical protein JXA60_01765, partial [Candidatus Coatesbacteria bacterium]|nr:hypothetical protein [Candidatus Coatesbacteria bacterium]